MSDQKFDNQADRNEKDAQINKSEELNVSSDFVQSGSQKVYDPGESVVNKMNRERAVFNVREFFQDLYENWLMAVERNEDRVLPSGIVMKWDMSTTFGDFMRDALDNVNRQIESVKFAKREKPHKISSTGGDFFLSEAKIDPGSSAVTKDFSAEDYDALYEILSKTKESIRNYLNGNLKVIINEKTGVVRTCEA
jgi:hypothetical protein